MIAYRTGNAANPTERPALIVHVVNDLGAWGRGFTASLDELWPEARASYRRNGVQPLGAVAAWPLAEGLWIAHLWAQHGLPGPANPAPLRLDALDTALQALAGALRSGVVPTSLHMPRIGCGLARGSWPTVEALLHRRLDAYPITVYDLPESR